MIVLSLYLTITLIGDDMIDRKKQNTRQDAWVKENRDVILIKAPKGTKEAWQKKADAQNLSLTQWVIKKCSED